MIDDRRSSTIYIGTEKLTGIPLLQLNPAPATTTTFLLFTIPTMTLSNKILSFPLRVSYDPEPFWGKEAIFMVISPVIWLGMDIGGRVT